MNVNNINSFIEKSSFIHENRYDYSKYNYANCLTKVDIICPIHGTFSQTPRRHLSGFGCQKCSFLKKITNQTKTTEKFIEEARSIHGNFYDYSLTNYKNSKTDVKIICKLHGEFLQNPHHHLNGHGCSKCAGCKPLTKQVFVQRANEIHMNKYNYNFLEYTSLNNKVDILCSVHGLFSQNALNHLHGAGCPSCSGSIKHTTESFIEKCKFTHGERYDYSCVDYKNNKENIKIICKEHGAFLQRPIHHSRGSGCPKCKSSRGEKIIRNILENNNIKFTEQKKFSTCKNIKELPFDFYLDDLDVLIEYQGEHHFEPKSKTRMFGASNTRGAYLKVKHSDQIKSTWCQNNNKKLLAINYEDIDKIEEIFIEEILSGIM